MKQKRKKESKERRKAKREKQPPTQNPRRPEMELNSLEMRGVERRRSQEVKPWVPNQNPSANPSKNQVFNLQSVRNLVKKSSGSNDMKGRQALKEKMGEMKRVGGRFKFSAPTNWSTDSSTGRPSSQRSTVKGQRHDQRSIFPIFLAFSCLVILPLLFSVEIPNFLCPMPREF